MAESLNDTTEWGSVTIKIPPELAGYEGEFRRFWDAMVFKMRRNAHKGRWENVPLEQAYQDLGRETLELKLAVERSNVVEIWTESADVANEALIISSIALRDENPQKTESTQHSPTGQLIPLILKHDGKDWYTAVPVVVFGGETVKGIGPHDQVRNFAFDGDRREWRAMEPYRV